MSPFLEDHHQGRGNALRIMGGILQVLLDQLPVEIASINGGSAQNAIPREAAALVLLDPARESELNSLRAPLLKALKTTLCAPNQVALYLFGDGSWVVENFNDTPATVELNGKKLTVPARGWVYKWN